MIRFAGAIAIVTLGSPVPCMAAPSGPPPVAMEGRYGRIATMLVRRYCLPTYIMKSLRKGSTTGQWTWASVELPDGKWRVAVDDFTWDVEVGSKVIMPGPVVVSAIEKGRLPEVCLCAEGIPRPPGDWEPRPAEDEEESAAPAAAVSVPAAATPVAPVPASSAGSKPAEAVPAAPTVPETAEGTAEPAAKSAPSPREPAPARKTTTSSSASGGLPGWLPGTWEGTTAGGARVRVAFSQDGTWKREILGSGGTADLTVSGTWKVAGTAIKLKVGSVRTAPKAKPAEKPPKKGSTVDAYCYRGAEGGLIMLTSGNTFRARRIGD